MGEEEQEASGAVLLHVARAEELPVMDRGGTSDPYVRIRLHGEERRCKTVRKSLAPTWNETLAFPFARLRDLNPQELCQVQVMHHDRVGVDEKMCAARVALGRLHPDNAPREIAVELECMTSLSGEVSGVHYATLIRGLFR